MSWDWEKAKREAAEATPRDVNGYAIEAGQILWDNNLDLVEIVKLNDHIEMDYRKDSEPGAEDGWTAWHKTRRLKDGRLSTSDDGPYGRLTYHYGGRLARDEAITRNLVNIHAQIANPHR